MAEPKSLLDRIGDALKGEAEQKKETVTKAAETARKLPDAVEREVATTVNAAEAKVADATQKLESQVSDLRSQLVAKERELNQKAGEFAQKERAWVAKERELTDKVAALEAELKKTQDVAARSVAAAAAPTRTYTVKPGDSLSAIAKALYGNAARWPEIFEANKDKIKDPALIRPGQELRIP